MPLILLIYLVIGSVKNLDMDLDRNSHSVYNLNYHLVLVVKYRRKVINNEISNRLKDIFDYVGKTYGVIITE